MLGIVLVSHGNLSKEMLSVAEHVVGKQTGIECVSIFVEDDVELTALLKIFEELLEDVDIER